jgi:hypothetical protein
MNFRRYLIHSFVALLCGLSLPAHALCVGPLGQCILSVKTINQLQFGSMVITASGVVTLDSHGGTLSGPVITPAFLKGNTSPATFIVSCRVDALAIQELGGFSYMVSVFPAPDLQKTDSTPSSAIPISQFSISPLSAEAPSATNTYTVEKCAGYSKTFTVEARLAVGALQKPGNYDSKFTFQASILP